MKIEKIKILNLNSIKDETIELDNLTILLGSNGSGKSTFLKALNLFKDSDPKIKDYDFFNNDISKKIVIAITFNNILKKEDELFNKYIEANASGEKILTVERVFSYIDAKTIKAQYHGSVMGNKEFKVIRDIEAAKEKKIKYLEFKKMDQYKELPDWKNESDAMIALQGWEQNHPERCERIQDEGNFFGFNSVAKGYLGKFVKIIRIPAVLDAADVAMDKKDSVLNELMDLVVRSRIDSRKEVVDFKANTQTEYKKIYNKQNLTELSELEKKMDENLKIFAKESEIKLDWLPFGEVDIPTPRADIDIVENGFKSKVSRVGHGLQRALIMSMLQILAWAQTKNKKPENGKDDEFEGITNLVLAIEEPELYQHPNRQRSIATILRDLSTGRIKGVANSIQVLYSTHSPLFISLESFNNTRRLTRVNDGDNPKITKITKIDLKTISRELSIAYDRAEETEEKLQARLKTIMTPWMNEGFFSDKVVLVEGESDRAVLLGTAKYLGYDLENMGISIIPCLGKNKMSAPYLIFKKLGIPIYLVWDGDYGMGEIEKECEYCHKKSGKSDAKSNKILLKMLNKPNEEWPSFSDKAGTCFKTNLETSLSKEVGENEYNEILMKIKDEFGFTKNDHAKKNPNVISRMLEEFNRLGRQTTKMENIIKNIVS